LRLLEEQQKRAQQQLISLNRSKTLNATPNIDRPAGPIRQKYLDFVTRVATPAQKEAHFRGGFGTGKSTMLVERHGRFRLEYPGSPGLICRSSFSVFKRTTLVKFKLLWEQYGEFKNQESEFHWFNGSVSYFFGLDAPNSLAALKSFEALDVAVDEADEIDLSLYLVANGRTRWQPSGALREKYLKKGLCKVYIDLNGIEQLDLPYSTDSVSNFNGKDFIYYRFKEKRHVDEKVATRAYFEAQTMENHSLPPNYVDDLIAGDNGEEFVKRFVYGDDSINFGRILTKWNGSRDDDGNPLAGSNLFYPASIPDYFPLYVGVDVGFQHPTAGLVARVSEDGRIWITHEYLEAERVAIENARAIKSLCGTVKIAATYGSPDAARKDQTSGRSASDDYRTAGITIIPAMLNHDDSVNTVNTMLRPLQLEPGQTSKPRVMVSTSCTRLIQQIEGYTWQLRRKKAGSGSQKTDPTGGDWDLYDTFRMLLCSIPVTTRAPSDGILSAPYRVEKRKMLGGY
jgi:hypothetical protein